MSTSTALTSQTETDLGHQICFWQINMLKFLYLSQINWNQEINQISSEEFCAKIKKVLTSSDSCSVILMPLSFRVFLVKSGCCRDTNSRFRDQTKGSDETLERHKLNMAAVSTKPSDDIIASAAQSLFSSQRNLNQTLRRGPLFSHGGESRAPRGPPPKPKRPPSSIHADPRRWFLSTRRRRGGSMTQKWRETEKWGKKQTKKQNQRK